MKTKAKPTASLFDERAEPKAEPVRESEKTETRRTDRPYANLGRRSLFRERRPEEIA